MKPILTTLFLVCISTIALSQEYNAIIGKNPTCNRHGGICSMQSSNDKNKSTNPKNVSFIYTKGGATILRIYRKKLTKDEQDRILGMPITDANKSSLQFVMQETITLPENIIAITAAKRSRQISVLEAKSYQTVISDTYIDITIVAPENNIKTKE